MLCAVAFALPAVGLYAGDDIVIADFEDGYGEWQAEGDAFGSAPAKGKIGGQQHVSGFAGKGLVNTFLKGDTSTGTLTSPAFEVKRKYIAFLIGGGAHKDTCLQLLVDGKPVASRSGDNDELLMPGLFDVEKHKGKMVQLRIVDKVKGGWGHVNVDHIVQTDTKPKVPKTAGSLEKEFTIENKYLIMPIKNGKGGGIISVFVDDEEVRRYGINLAPAPLLFAESKWHQIRTFMYDQGIRPVISQDAENEHRLTFQTDNFSAHISLAENNRALLPILFPSHQFSQESIEIASL